MNESAVGPRAPAAAPWALAALPAGAHLWRSGHGPGWVLALAACAALVAIVVAVRPRAWPLGVAGAVLAFELATDPGLLSSPPAPHPVADLLVLSPVLWALALGLFPAPGGAPLAPSAARARLLVLPLLGATAALLAREDLVVPAVLLGLAVAVWAALLVAPRGAGAELDRAGAAVGRAEAALRRRIEALARVAGRVVAAVAMVPAAVILLVTWAVQRLLRYDPLASPAPTGSTWVERRSPDVAPERLGARVLTVDGRSGRRRAHQWGTSLLVLAVWALLASALLPGDPVLDRLRDRDDVQRADGPTGPDAPRVDEELPAAQDLDWFPSYMTELEWAMRPGTGFSPLDALRTRDLRGRYINVRDGRRVGWSPPSCGCRRLRVWFYGASTTFGLGQRDDHTPPSELARVAWEQDGLALDVDNRGVVGDTHWEEAQRLAWDLAGEDPPDLVVFYDGVNDTTAARFATRATERAGPAYVDRATWLQLLELDEFDRIAGPELPTPPGAALVPDPPLDDRSPEERGRTVAARYERSRETAAIVAGARGAPVEWFWQPGAVHRRPEHLEVELGDEPDPLRREAAAAVAGLGADVHDISRTFDAVEEPVFLTPAHTNEVGARLVAEAIYDVIGARLRDLAQG